MTIPRPVSRSVPWFPALLAALLLAASGTAQTDAFAQRKNGRKELTKKHAKAAHAIFTGLEWLRLHQAEDGRWDADEFMAKERGGDKSDGPGSPTNDVGVTALALLAFTGNGHRPGEDLAGTAVAKAAAWLINQQGDDGLFGAQAAHDYVYNHAIAALAMCEVAAESDKEVVRAAAQAGLDYLEKHRNPYQVWRYMPRDGDNDSSITSWATQAYALGRDIGLEVPAKAFPTITGWFDQVTDPETGRTGYAARGEPSARLVGDHGTRFPPDKVETMTAAGLFCRSLLGQTAASNKVMERSAALLLDKLPTWDEESGAIDHYYWFYGSAALRQMGGDAWREWSAALRKAVVEHQRQDGHFMGSWDPVGVWGENGGRIYSTALMVLALESHYRLVPAED